MKQLKVILVDDESIVISDMLTLINWEENGFSVAGWAYSAEHAIELVKEQHPDIAFMDVSLPSSDGIQLSKLLKEIQPDLVIVILSGYMDFSYAQRSIDIGTFTYLVKHQLTADKLLDVLSKIRDMIEKREVEVNIIRRQLVSNILAGTVLAAQLTDLEKKYLSIYENSFVMIALTPCVPFFKQDSSFTVSPSSIMKVSHPVLYISDVLLQKDTIIMITQSSQRIISKSTYLSMVQELIQSVQECISLNSTQRFFAVYLHLSRASTIYSMYEDFILLNRYLPQYIFHENTPVIMIDNVSEYYDNIEDLSFISVNSFLNSYSQTVEKISEYLKKAVSTKNYTAFSACTTEILKLLHEFNFDLSQNDLQLYDAKQIMKCLLKYLENIHHNLTTKQIYSAITNYVIQFINKNYNRQPSLNEVAEQLNSNSMYVGQKFKKDTGKSFHDYLTECRILHAKSLLADTNLKMFEISDQIGITNSQYFSKIFKEYTGLTPYEYRNQHYSL